MIACPAQRLLHRDLIPMGSRLAISVRDLPFARNRGKSVEW